MRVLLLTLAGFVLIACGSQQAPPARDAFIEEEITEKAASVQLQDPTTVVYTIEIEDADGTTRVLRMSFSQRDLDAQPAIAEAIRGLLVGEPRSIKKDGQRWNIQLEAPTAP